MCVCACVWLPGVGCPPIGPCLTRKVRGAGCRVLLAISEAGGRSACARVGPLASESIEHYHQRWCWWHHHQRWCWWHSGGAGGTTRARVSGATTSGALGLGVPPSGRASPGRCCWLSVKPEREYRALPPAVRWSSCCRHRGATTSAGGHRGTGVRGWSWGWSRAVVTRVVTRRPPDERFHAIAARIHKLKRLAWPQRGLSTAGGATEGPRGAVGSTPRPSR